jgi:hypothetical protein
VEDFMVSISLFEESDWLCSHDDTGDPPWRWLHQGLLIRGRVGPSPSHARVALRGEVDAFCERALEGVFLDLLDVGITSVLVDLAEVVFVDGAGARALAVIACKLEECGASVTKLLEMTGLGRLLAPAT